MKKKLDILERISIADWFLKFWHTVTNYTSKLRVSHPRFTTGHHKDIFIEVLLKVLNEADCCRTCVVGQYLLDIVLWVLSDVFAKLKGRNLQLKFYLCNLMGLPCFVIIESWYVDIAIGDGKNWDKLAFLRCNCGIGVEICTAEMKNHEPRLRLVNRVFVTHSASPSVQFSKIFSGRTKRSSSTGK